MNGNLYLECELLHIYSILRKEEFARYFSFKKIRASSGPISAIFYKRKPLTSARGLGRMTLAFLPEVN